MHLRCNHWHCRMITAVLLLRHLGAHVSTRKRSSNALKSCGYELVPLSVILTPCLSQISVLCMSQAAQQCKHGARCKLKALINSGELSGLVPQGATVIAPWLVAAPVSTVLLSPRQYRLMLLKKVHLQAGLTNRVITKPQHSKAQEPVMSSHVIQTKQSTAAMVTWCCCVTSNVNSSHATFDSCQDWLQRSGRLEWTWQLSTASAIILGWTKASTTTWQQPYLKCPDTFLSSRLVCCGQKSQLATCCWWTTRSAVPLSSHACTQSGLPPVRRTELALQCYQKYIAWDIVLQYYSFALVFGQAAGYATQHCNELSHNSSTESISQCLCAGECCTWWRASRGNSILDPQQNSWSASSCWLRGAHTPTLGNSPHIIGRSNVSCHLVTGPWYHLPCICLALRTIPLPAATFPHSFTTLFARQGFSLLLTCKMRCLLKLRI